MKTENSLKTVQLALLFLLWALCAPNASAWDYEGHRLINQLALTSLPANFPGFCRTPEARERIAFLAGEPDRWRNTPELALKHVNGPDHYLDLEDLAPYHLEPPSLPRFRYDFIAQLAVARAMHPDRFPPIDPLMDADHTRALVGFLPWTITEYYARLKSAFSYLKAFEEAGASVDATNAADNVVYLMGVMGHFVGDSGQPLHSTSHFNGWTGANPHGYTTNKSFHRWIDGGYLQKLGVHSISALPKLRSAHLFSGPRPASSQDDPFPRVIAFLCGQNRLVEPLYILEKEGRLSRDGPVDPAGREFILAQVAAAAQLLGDLWYTAWQEAPPDPYLKAQLAKRPLPVEPPKASP